MINTESATSYYRQGINEAISFVPEPVQRLILSYGTQHPFYFPHVDDSYYIHNKSGKTYEQKVADIHNFLSVNKVELLQTEVDEKVSDAYFSLSNSLNPHGVIESLRIRQTEKNLKEVDSMFSLIIKFSNWRLGPQLARVVLCYYFQPKPPYNSQSFIKDLSKVDGVHQSFVIEKFRFVSFLNGKHKTEPDRSISGTCTRLSFDKITKISSLTQTPTLNHSSLFSDLILEFERPILGWTEQAELKFKQYKSDIFSLLSNDELLPKLSTKFLSFQNRKSLENKTFSTEIAQNSRNPTIEVGEAIHPPSHTYENLMPQYKSCRVRVPVRVETFFCRPERFRNRVGRSQYPVGSINFSLDLFNQVNVTVLDSDQFDLTQLRRPLVALHVCKLFQKFLGFTCGLKVEIEMTNGIVHGGLGSTASINAAIALAINKIFGSKYNYYELIEILRLNYGEESNCGTKLLEEPSLGGASAIAYLPANLVIMGDDGKVAFEHSLPESYKLVLGFPVSKEKNDHLKPPKLFAALKMLAAMGFELGDKKWAAVQNCIIPQLKSNSLDELFYHINLNSSGHYGDLPGYYQYQWESEGYDFKYLMRSASTRLTENLDNKKSCFFVSAKGPALVFITEEPNRAIELCADLPVQWNVRNLVNSGPECRLYK